MGFEVLAALKQQLAEQAKQQAPKQTRPARARKPAQGQKSKQRDNAPAVDPVLAAISRLQRHYPAAFPKKPEPKKPLKVGIFQELEAHGTHGLDAELLKQALAAWCQGWRYWDCLKTGNARVDLTGTACGEVTQAEERRAKQLAYQHRQSKRTSTPRKEDSAKTATVEPAAEAAPEPTTQNEDPA